MAIAVNDTVSGLSEFGTDLGGFLENLAPGVGIFVLLMGIFGGVTALIYGIVVLIKRKISV